MNDNLFVRETYINATEGYRFGESDVYETEYDNLGELYHSLRRAHGRCTGRVYIDTEGKTLTIGWVFIKRTRYEDVNDMYLREVWVEVHDELPTEVWVEHDGLPTVTTRYQYHSLKA